MSVHLFPIFVSLVAFFVLANLLSIPWIIYQYRRHGYFNFWRSVVLVSFLFYLMTAFLLVILPLPEVHANCAGMVNTVFSQVKPFQFVDDIVRETGVVWSSPGTYSTLLRASSVNQVFFNILLLFPLGVYLRYYFKKRSKWYYALISGFFLSLFFEVTQRTGIFGIYECPYRLFDVDDLIMNTLGAVSGYFLGSMILFFFPTRENVESADQRFQTEKQASYGIQLIELIITISISSFIAGIVTAPMQNLPFFADSIIFFTVVFFFLVLMPYFFAGHTLGGLILRVRISRESKSFWKLMKRYIIIIIPYLLSRLTDSISVDSEDILMNLFGIGLTFASFFIWFIILIHVIVKWLKKSHAPYFNAFADLKMERINKKSTI